MDARYRLRDTSDVISPALVIFEEVLDENLDKMLAIAGDTNRLRPHCKTHKMREVVERQIAKGIHKHKCATLAEAEMLALAGVRDVFLAYNPVGPNIGRVVQLLNRFPELRFSVTADHPEPVRRLGAALAAAGRTVDVLLDLDTGQHRTGLAAGPEARQLYALIADTPGLQAGGIHLYDGQNHQTDLDERRRAVQACWEQAAALRDELEAAGLSVPRIVAGGTGSFPVFAAIDDRAIELSPGTCVFHDTGYGQMFPDLDFVPAALILTRVISRPTPDRVTVDLGYKACASDPPAGKRLAFPDLPDAEEVLQNEEHLVLRTADAQRFQPGDELLAIPRHACPTSALHKQAYVARGGRIAARWDVVARDRQLTI